MVSLGIVNLQPLKEMTRFGLKMSSFYVNFFQIRSARETSNGCVSLYKSTHSNLYVHAKCTCKILNTEQKKRGRTRLQLYKHYSTEQMLLLWLEKTMLAPTCTISSLLILTITVRRTRWSVGRGVLRVVTQAYQGDEETRLTEPRYCWPTTFT